MDLRNTISAVARLPFDSDKLVDILCETDPAAANNPDDPDHTTFWLVGADQFARRAIVCDRARDKALTIIDTGSDIAMLGKLGLSVRPDKKTEDAGRCPGATSWHPLPAADHGLFSGRHSHS